VTKTSWCEGEPRSGDGLLNPVTKALIEVSHPFALSCSVVPTFYGPKHNASRNKNQ
jgi:hypothetical protein